MQVKTAKFTKEDQALYDEFLEKREQAKGLSAIDERRKELVKLIAAKFGDCNFARLPDGRVIQRVEKTRQVAAKDAREDKWFELHESAA